VGHKKKNQLVLSTQNGLFCSSYKYNGQGGYQKRVMAYWGCSGPLNKWMKIKLWDGFFNAGSAIQSHRQPTDITSFTGALHQFEAGLYQLADTTPVGRSGPI
jgi:hypothetical protein